MFRMPAKKFSGRVAVFDPDIERGTKLTSLLTTLELSCVQASSLDELSRCFYQNSIALVIADNDDGAGFLLASTMRSHPLMLDVPLMLLTDQSQPGALQRDLACAPDALIHKPFNMPHLLSQLNKLVQRGCNHSIDANNLAESMWRITPGKYS